MDVIVKDVLVAGLVDDDIRKETLGWSELDDKTIDQTVTYIEGKEMARDALLSKTTNAGISAHKAKSKAGSSYIL